MTKLYKIFNQDKNHHGYKYKVGLNKLKEKFNPSGDCTPGGFYYASKDILAFLDYGPYISEIKLCKDSKVYANPGTPEKFKTDKFRIVKFRKITAKVIAELIKDGADIHANDDGALILASENGHTEVVKLLIKAGVDIHAYDEEAFRYASENGHIEVVKLLIKAGADIHIRNDYALRWASENGHTEVVKLLKKASK